MRGSHNWKLSEFWVLGRKTKGTAAWRSMKYLYFMSYQIEHMKEHCNISIHLALVGSAVVLVWAAMKLQPTATLKMGRSVWESSQAGPGQLLLLVFGRTLCWGCQRLWSHGLFIWLGFRQVGGGASHGQVVSEIQVEAVRLLSTQH